MSKNTPLPRFFITSVDPCNDLGGEDDDYILVHYSPRCLLRAKEITNAQGRPDIEVTAHTWYDPEPDDETVEDLLSTARSWYIGCLKYTLSVFDWAI